MNTNNEVVREININFVVENALEVLSLDLHAFQKIAGEILTKNLTPEGQLNLNHALGIDVVQILELLYLCSSHLYEGYDREKHLIQVCHAIEKGEYSYKKGKIVKAFFGYFKAVRWEQESKYFSFRQRWKIRLKRWFYSGPFYIRKRY